LASTLQTRTPSRISASGERVPRFDLGGDANLEVVAHAHALGCEDEALVAVLELDGRSGEQSGPGRVRCRRPSVDDVAVFDVPVRQVRLVAVRGGALNVGVPRPRRCP